MRKAELEVAGALDGGERQLLLSIPAATGGDASSRWRLMAAVGDVGDVGDIEHGSF